MALSFVASLLDGVIIGATVAEVESLKEKSPWAGNLFESFQANTDRVLSAVLAIDTGAACICSMLLGSLVENKYGVRMILPFSCFVTVLCFVFTDILPKVLGIYYRKKLLYWSVFPLRIITWIMFPISYVCAKIVDIFLPKKKNNGALSDEAIILTARRGVRDGILSSIEGDMVEHTLTLDDVEVEIITQKKIFSIGAAQTIGQVFRRYPEIPYGRIPVFEGERSNVIGIVHRRELLRALAADEHERTVKSMVRKIVRVPKNAKISSVLEILLQHFQQIALVEGENCAVVGVVTIEDIFEYIIGRDIFEYDDLSNLSRNDARKLRLLRKKRVAAESPPRPTRRRRGEGGAS
ncbi:MAG: CNNM domain-containing protein [Puniceicoccales bacterium]|nr:CNNM domain-containing protein [Puniceicoccales bacterium]